MEFSKQEILDALNNCSTQAQIKKYLHTSYINFQKHLDLYGLKYISKEIIHPEIDKEWLIKNWVNTDKRIKTLAKELGIKESLLEGRILKLGLNKHYKYQFNKTKYFDLKNPNTYYIAGLLATDGFLNRNNNFISFSLSGESEKNLLQDILNYYESSYTIRQYKGNTITYIQFAADRIKEFYKDNFNIPAINKTFTVSTPTQFYSEDCIKAYILGCLDGDGCISHIQCKKPTIVLTTASFSFITGLIDIINKNLNFNLILHYANNYPSLQISGKYKVIQFLDWVYSANVNFYLKRKYEKYLMVKDIV